MRLHEKGGKHHEMHCQHNLKDWGARVREYIETARIAEDGSVALEAEASVPLSWAYEGFRCQS
jgi:hypothetical protein